MQESSPARSCARLLPIFAAALCFSDAAFAGILVGPRPIPALDEFGLVSLAVGVAAVGLWVLGKNRKK